MTFASNLDMTTNGSVTNDGGWSAFSLAEPAAASSWSGNLVNPRSTSGTATSPTVANGTTATRNAISVVNFRK